MAEGIGPCKLDQIITDHDGNWYGLVRLNIGQKIAHGSECYNMTGPSGIKKFADWKGVRLGHYCHCYYSN
jgi:hypothetical protein